jgi:hypothetical protein
LAAIVGERTTNNYLQKYPDKILPLFVASVREKRTKKFDEKLEKK